MNPYQNKTTYIFSLIDKQNHITSEQKNGLKRIQTYMKQTRVKL